MNRAPAITPLPGKTNSMLVYEQLEKLISTGFWQPDERILPESELCSRFNVGRSTIREALNMLKARNLIHTVPGVGSFVRRLATADPSALPHIPDPKCAKDLLNIMELRLSLEPASAAFAARRATAANIREMEVCQATLTSSANPDVFAESDLAFHMLVALATGNPVVMDVMNMAKRFLVEQQIITSRAEGRRATAAAFHDRILAGIRAGDPVVAETAMREHMEDTYAYVASFVAVPDDRGGLREPPQGAE